MAPRTLASTWKSFEKLCKRYESASVPRKAEIAALDELCSKANGSGIVGALATLFVHDYPGLEEVEVEFVPSADGDYPDWVTAYCSERQVIQVNPVGVLRFSHECRDAVQRLKSAAARENFYKYRYQAYLAQLRKLPTDHLLFLQLLREVATARGIAEVERKGGGLDTPKDEGYMLLLWAFNELEALFAEFKGLNLRSEYGISWYESDWFVGTEGS